MGKINGFTPVPTEDSQHVDEQTDGIQGGEVNGFGLDSPDVSAEQTESGRVEPPPRAQWSRSIEFILSCVGFAVGLGNVWRFPYLCFKNGGGVFLIPYFIFMIIAGIPLFFLEISLGQFMGVAGIKVWNIAPILKGIGIATTVIVFLMNCYYIIILCWDGFFLADTLAHIGKPLPWSHCNNTWNTPDCKTDWFEWICTNVTDVMNRTALNSTNAGNMTGNVTEVCERISHKGEDSVTEYWENRILRMSDSVTETGEIVWQLAVSLFVMWIICYFCIWKGVKWTGKVVYVTATLPYVIITILLIRGVTLPGAGKGLMFYLKPDFTKLANLSVWVDAGSQIFFSYAVALGALTAMGSYNKYNNNCHRQVWIIALINSGTSLYAGIAVFSVLGYMAQSQGVEVEDVVAKGPGLAFIAYPKAVATMPVAPHLWACLFFIMIIFVGLDSQFVAVESFITNFADMFPQHFHKPYRREIFTAVYCLISALIGLTMVTQGGIYVFELFNYYSASGLSLLWVAFWECAALAWIYGVNRFYSDLEIMLGFKIGPWFKICWLVLTPLASSTLYIIEYVVFQPLAVGKHTYPRGVQACGVLMAAMSMICIPGYAVYALIVTPGTFKQRLVLLTTPILRVKPELVSTSSSNDSIELGDVNLTNKN